MTPTAKVSGKERIKPATAQFWTLARKQASLTEFERIETIRHGFEAVWLLTVKANFNLTMSSIAALSGLSAASIDRRIKGNDFLNPVASERLDRLAQTAVLAEDVFEDKEVASKWMSTPNDLLAGLTPLDLCETGLGARQVRRVLHSIEWGNVA